MLLVFLCRPRFNLDLRRGAPLSVSHPPPRALPTQPLSRARAPSDAHTGGEKKKVWKTYLGRNRGTGTLDAVRDIYKSGGVPPFLAGPGAKMVESASKGLILMWSKESLLGVLEKAHVSPGA